MHLKSAHAKQHANPGFSLVVTVSMLILLTVIAVGLLTLSSISIKSSGIGAAESRARANARMALMMALDRLQTEMGPDQRVSANADILSATTSVTNPHWVGVWDSWIAGAPGTARVNPSYPSALNSTHQTIGAQADPLLRPTYSQKDRHFRGWLLSMNPEDVTNINTAWSPSFEGVRRPNESDNAVVLVGEGSLGQGSSATDKVSAQLIEIEPNEGGDKNRGRFAWWVGDQNQKAMIMEDSYKAQASLTPAEKIFRSEAPASMGNTSITGLEQMEDEAQIAKLGSQKTLELMGGVTAEKAQLRFHDVTTSSYGVLADVREGGLKRDLSTILERTIDPEEVYNMTYVSVFQRPISYKPGGEAFMLYNFDSLLQSANPLSMASVPIQDLAAYYQMYDSQRPGWKGGIQFSSNQSDVPNSLLPTGIMTSNPHGGHTSTDHQKYLRQHTYIYRNPVVVKYEVVIHYVTVPRPQVDIDTDVANGITDPDTHILRFAVSPGVTLWNPNNVPLVMNLGNPQLYSWFTRDKPMPLRFQINKLASPSGPLLASATRQARYVTHTNQGEILQLFISGNSPLVFQPGESKVLSLQFSSGAIDADLGVDTTSFLGQGASYQERFVPQREVVPGWNPRRFVRPNFYAGGQNGPTSNILTFKAADYISTDISVQVGDSPFDLFITPAVRQPRNTPPTWYNGHLYGIRARTGASNAFRQDQTYMGFPPVGRGDIASPAPRTIISPAKKCEDLIKGMGDPTNLKDDLPAAFCYFSMNAACETHESQNLTPILGGSARRFPARPFLHSSPLNPKVFTDLSGSSLYDTGMSWFVLPLSNLFDAPISISTTNSGYYGGGYTAENGTTTTVQQQLPLAPPISIAALSHARLGGYGLATEAANGMGEDWRRVNVCGYGGLRPYTLQAIGNSYAHPNIPADKAYITKNLTFTDGVNTRMPYADHSYLANKALWDDFFFSSMTPVPGNNPIFDSSPKSVEDVAKDFFFQNKPLPNRRIVPYSKKFDESRLSYLISQYPDFLDGFADKIAAHLMVKGTFNVNSTSVEAWKALFSSLKGKPVAYFDKDTSLNGVTSLQQDTPAGVPVAASGVPNAKTYTGSSADPSDAEQWVGWRVLGDEEIEELAKAMVKQVKKRGPFLSLSEFVNRRLDSSNAELSVKGALQAAIDDPDIPTNKAINGGFRSSSRKFSATEVAYANTTFREAMEGPIAYGSSAYVDQADILRNLAEQLTPRGDTFVIRTYGDSLDANGNVEARAWCEAVVQRMPDYLDSADENHVKQANLTSTTNKIFGRKFEIISFRWLHSDEI